MKILNVYQGRDSIGYVELEFDNKTYVLQFHVYLDYDKDVNGKTLYDKPLPVSKDKLLEYAQAAVSQWLNFHLFEEYKKMQDLKK